MCQSCADAIGEAWAAFVSCVRNGDANNLDRSGVALAQAMEDTAIGTARLADLIEELPLSTLIQGRFISVAVHQYAVFSEAQELDHGVVLKW